MNYEVFGLRLSSELALDELARSAASSWDVAIRFGEVPGEAVPAGYSRYGDAILLSVPGVARYRISDGREIVIEAAAAAQDDSIRLYLLGSALGAILHQRGLLPLHANAIEIDGRAVAFMGPSGAGKSTLAAWFHDRGYPVLTDDVCVVEKGAHGPIIHGGIPRLRLSEEALTLSGRSVGDYPRGSTDADKFHVATGALEKPPRPVPLARIYLLQKGESATQTIDRLQGVEALDAIMANTYRGALVEQLGATERHLALCLALVRQVPIMRVTRPWDMANFDVQARALEAHAMAPDALTGSRRDSRDGDTSISDQI